MDFIGKVIVIGQKRSGTSSSGKPWSSQDFVVENNSSRYPSRLCFSVFGEDRLQQFNIQMGEMLSVSFDVDAHEHQGRWFNNINAYAVNRINTTQPQSQQPTSAPIAPDAAFGPVSPTPTQNPPVENNLPF